MIPNLVSLLAGIIFALGLVVSGMIDPNKVKGFLDIFGEWDYSLIFVMGGAVGFNLFAFKYLMRRKPLYSDQHFMPTKQEIDLRLMLGSAFFGIGWGLIGICPGPAIVNLVTLDSSVLLFSAAMLVGMLIHRRLL